MMRNLFKKITRFFIFCWFLFFSSDLFAQSLLKSIYFSHKNNTPVLVAELNQSTRSHVFSLSHPSRIVLDFDQTKLHGAHLKTMLQQTKSIIPAITNIRVGYPHKNVLRVVLDVNQSVHYRFIVSPHKTKMMLIFVSLRIKSVVKNTSAPVKIHTVTVVIDPGHGGKDPGALGTLGGREKNIVLSIAKKLAILINQTPHMRAILTRKGDYFVPLRGRLHLARRGKADIFIAIHADSWFNRHERGASIYALSQHGATSEAARWLAGRENTSELAGVNLRELSDQSYLLRSVLIDLEQTATIRDSLRLGHILLTDLHQVTRLHYHHVEQAPFMVLKSPDIPSVLIETGFLSNRQEEQHLRDPVYQGKIARAILAGIKNYIRQYPQTII